MTHALAHALSAAHPSIDRNGLVARGWRRSRISEHLGVGRREFALDEVLVAESSPTWQLQHGKRFFKRELLARGWDEGLIDELLGEPDGYGTHGSYHYAYGRVFAAEDTTTFVVAHEALALAAAQRTRLADTSILFAERELVHRGWSKGLITKLLGEPVTKIRKGGGCYTGVVRYYEAHRAYAAEELSPLFARRIKLLGRAQQRDLARRATEAWSGERRHPIEDTFWTRAPRPIAVPECTLIDTALAVLHEENRRVKHNEHAFDADDFYKTKNAFVVACVRAGLGTLYSVGDANRLIELAASDGTPYRFHYPSFVGTDQDPVRAAPCIYAEPHDIAQPQREWTHVYYEGHPLNPAECLAVIEAATRHITGLADRQRQSA